MGGAQDEALGGQARAVLGLHQQARAAPAEGLDGEVRVPQHHDLGAPAVGVGAGEGRQEAGRGGGAVLVVVDDDQVGHGAGPGHAPGPPRLQGLHGAVLDAGGVHPADLAAALGGGPALGVPGAQEGGGRAPQGHVQLAPQGGQGPGPHAQLPGAGQQVAQLGAEGPGGHGLGRQPRPLLGADEGRQRGVLLGAGQQDRRGQRVGAAGEEGGEDREGVAGGGAHPYGAVGGARPRQARRAGAQGVGAGPGGRQEQGVAAPPGGVEQQVQRQAGLAGAGGPQDHEVGAGPHPPDHLPPRGVRVREGLERDGGQEPHRGEVAVVVHGPIRPRGCDANRRPAPGRRRLPPPHREATSAGMFTTEPSRPSTMKPSVVPWSRKARMRSAPGPAMRTGLPARWRVSRERKALTPR